MLGKARLINKISNAADQFLEGQMTPFNDNNNNNNNNLYPDAWFFPVSLIE
jgi:hypothetical protein